MKKHHIWRWLGKSCLDNVWLSTYVLLLGSQDLGISNSAHGVNYEND
ncbi:MAG: hypothetical protein O4808_10665 [Trichodesmium sp. St17_bin3_1_1]|nr:hypothetical protein [Trichodesmium sp. MAG_R02]MDE5107496.1 hypothetical protein [Trichodesmium sp. St17_bin3_1_1]